MDRYHGLVGKGLQQFGGGLGELAKRLAPDHQRTDDLFSSQQWDDQDTAISLPQDDVVDRRGRLFANVGNLDWPALLCRQPNVAVPEADMLVADRCNHGFAHAVSGMQAKLLPFLIEHVDRAGVGVRELHRPTDDGRENSFKV